MLRLCPVFCASLLVLASPHGAEAQQLTLAQLYGKSLIITIDDVLRGERRSFRETIYVSGAGRIFLRHGAEWQSGRRGAKDIVQGGSDGQVTFTGSGLTARWVNRRGRQIELNVSVFNNGGQFGCSARFSSQRERMGGRGGGRGGGGGGGGGAVGGGRGPRVLSSECRVVDGNALL